MGRLKVLFHCILISTVCQSVYSLDEAIRISNAEKGKNVSNLLDTFSTVTVAHSHAKRGRRFIPFARPTSRTENDTLECSSSSEDFPAIFTEKQRQQGGVLLCFLVGTYCFTLLAVICDKYFLPCVERICKVLHLSKDVAAATFMSIATSCPELFTNIISTFVTESDLGIGTIVGSSLFNALGVASLGGLFASRPIQLDWWPLTRDVIIYILAVSLLVCITWDDKIYWYEGLTLFIVYFLYFTVMFQNQRISRFVKKFLRLHQPEVDIAKESDPKKTKASLEPPVDEEASISPYGSYMEDAHTDIKKVEADEEEEKKFSLRKLPEGSFWKKLFYIYLWPIKFVLKYTVPNPKEHPSLFPLTFIMCILWIGSNSYIISWMIAIIGNVFRIPDAVLGLTFLAAGGCLPESISISIMSRRGEGGMGVSNSLGANTMNILLSLGMPWFFKTILKGTNDKSFIEIQSGSIEFTILALILVALILYMTLYFNKFRLSRTIGVILMTVYIVCVVLAILSEMVFFPSEIACSL